MKVTNWGNYPLIESELYSPAYVEDALQYVKEQQACISRGNGRCYGDASLHPQILSTKRLNKITAFDTEKGIISCQAGTLLSELLKVIVPKGFFLPVSPGTKFITVGGAIAADVHGKNHHKDGTFSNYLLSFTLLTSQGELIHCSREEYADTFWATCGGMGLTGIVTEACFSLRPINTSYIAQENLKAQNLDEVMELFEISEAHTYTVAWLDTMSKGRQLGRSIFMRGEHAERDQLKKQKQQQDPLRVHTEKGVNIPFYFPSFTLANISIKLFNLLYYHKSFRKRSAFISHYNPFFYPLDSLHHWNRIYGRNGFTQYQFVVPKGTGRETLHAVLKKMSEHRQHSFLTVLKLFGASSPLSPLSFPMEGYTLSLDFKITPQLFPLLDELDAIVSNFGGRVYLAKDVRMGRDFFQNSYSRIAEFTKTLEQTNRAERFQSLLSKRLGLTK